MLATDPGNGYTPLAPIPVFRLRITVLSSRYTISYISPYFQHTVCLSSGLQSVVSVHHLYSSQPPDLPSKNPEPSTHQSPIATPLFPTYAPVSVLILHSVFRFPFLSFLVLHPFTLHPTPNNPNSNSRWFSFVFPIFFILLLILRVYEPEVILVALPPWMGGLYNVTLLPISLVCVIVSERFLVGEMRPKGSAHPRRG